MNLILDVFNYILVAILIGVSSTWVILIKSMIMTFHESPFLDKFEKKDHVKPKVSIILLENKKINKANKIYPPYLIDGWPKNHSVSNINIIK